MDAVSRGRSLALTLVTILAMPQFAAAESSRAAPRAPQPSLHDSVEAAWRRLPDRRSFEGQRAAAAARLGAGGALLPNAPYFNGTYINDQVGSGQRYITYQGELATPIWLPGEGTATQNVARADLDSLSAQVDAAHLALANQVLDLAAQAALAANTRDVARRRVTTSQVLAADLGRRFRLGESAEADALVADADASNARLELASADAQLAAARAGLAAVTGSEEVPTLQPGGGAGVAMPDPNTHPRVVAARKAVDAARSAVSLAAVQNRESPTVGIQGIHEKQGAGQPYDTRFGLVVHLPFATEARNAPLRAAAQATLTGAEAQLDLALRQVVAERRQAEVILFGAQRSADAASRAATALATRRGQIERAWRAGEMPLLEVVRANAVTFDAELARDKARTNLGVAQQRARIVQGLLP